ncbi:hypothetical protein RJ55_01771 [Drechmeria coniospora]|nr:hypothetical protein RJ55_01771 [Drechmeria coniospora]
MPARRPPARRGLPDHHPLPVSPDDPRSKESIAMERSSKPADLALVSKYYPVANYSYPRSNDHGAPPCAATESSGRSDRSSLGSNASAPGLVDDRTDSDETESVDDDDQYHAHVSRLWDSFWSREVPRKSMGEEPLMELNLRKQYPALIPSPRRRRRQPSPAAPERTASWPLPDPDSPAERNRQPAAAFPSPPTEPVVRYSAFPKPTQAPKVPCMLSARTIGSGPSSINTPPPPASVRQPAISPTFAAEEYLPKPSFAMNWRRSSPIARPTSRPVAANRIRPMTASGGIRCVESLSSTHLPLDKVHQSPNGRGPRSSKSIANLVPPPPSPPEEPHSVFEDDSDSETDKKHKSTSNANNNGHGNGHHHHHHHSFFRFHKRSDSDNRRGAKHAKPDSLLRQRALTVPSSPLWSQNDRSGKQEPPARKRSGHDVFGRMLGRRSR